jgi:hypothetical protein
MLTMAKQFDRVVVQKCASTDTQTTVGFHFVFLYTIPRQNPSAEPQEKLRVSRYSCSSLWNLAVAVRGTSMACHIVKSDTSPLCFSLHPPTSRERFSVND